MNKQIIHTIFSAEDAAEFLQQGRLEDLVKRYSEFITFPIHLYKKTTEVVEEEDVPYEASAVKQSPAAKAIAKVESIDSNDSKVMDILNGLDNL
jgi:heat shock protein beta